MDRKIRTQPGFTLVELMVVIAITALLMAWGVPAFSTWNAKHNVESEMVQLYSDLQYARMNAYGDKVLTGIYWDGQGYHIAYDSNGDGVINNNDSQLGATVKPKYAVQGQQTVSFDGRGFLDPDPANAVTFSVSPSYGAPLDCVSVTLTRISLGKMNGTTCDPK